MNCFNIRELQGILKRRFFTDVVNSADHRTILSSSMIGLRFTENNNFNLDSDILSFHRLGTSTSPKLRLSSLHPSYGTYNGKTSSNFSSPASYFSKSPESNLNNSNLMSAIEFLRLPLDLVLNVLKVSLFHSTQSISLPSLHSSFLNTVSFNFRPMLPLNVNFYGLFTKSDMASVNNQASAATFSGRGEHTNSPSMSLYTNLESENLMRFSRFNSPVLSYDYKCGHYIGI